MVPLQRLPRCQDTLRNPAELCSVSRRETDFAKRSHPLPACTAEPGNQAAKVRTPVFLVSPEHPPHPDSPSVLQLARPLHPPSTVQVTSVAQSCPTLLDLMGCNIPGFPVLHHLPELAQTHVC